MKLFCLLWIPFFYLFWSSISSDEGLDSGGLWALLLGSIYAVVVFFFGPFIKEGGGFGYSRWLSISVDLVSVPALAPFVVFTLFLPFRVCRDVTRFTLLWLIPDMLIRIITWNVRNDPIQLILVPILRTAIAMGISGCIRLVIRGKVLGIITASLVLLALPFAASSCYWFFFCQRPREGFILLAITLTPMLLHCAFQLSKGFVKSVKANQ
ncbi:MAG: hypothetical protein LBK00_04415 [Treponema sp.]|jgi:hypothetical protein|nr:hypothetical protein [Treponema sp.]